MTVRAAHKVPYVAGLAIELSGEVDGSQVTVLELRSHPQDLGKVIRIEERTTKAVRTLLGR